MDSSGRNGIRRTVKGLFLVFTFTWCAHLIGVAVILLDPAREKYGPPFLSLALMVVYGVTVMLWSAGIVLRMFLKPGEVRFGWFLVFLTPFVLGEFASVVILAILLARQPEARSVVLATYALVCFVNGAAWLLLSVMRRA